ncbi:MAG: tetraacyldisaccharide 4'-kinase [Caulobacterales bacterium]|jgi:tetraacyldisaccharide 4'-kinase
MRAPAFWSGSAEGRDSALALQALAAPLSWLYGAVTAAKIAATKPIRVSRPVICIGNVSVGGVGKTPVVRALRDMLTKNGVKPAVLARGHGGRLKGPLLVDAIRHSAEDVGDEPLLHARDGLTFIARDRLAGAHAAIAAGADAIVMDDGFQNPALHKDFSFLVFDAASGLGNGKVLPAGPLREPLANAIARAHAAILIGAGPSLPLGALPAFGATIEATASAPPGPLVAFAGIGRPEKFFATLNAHSGEVVEAVPFADHHRFTATDLAFLDKLSAERGARLICTEKDHVRLPPDWRDRVATLSVTARFADPAAVMAALTPALRLD